MRKIIKNLLYIIDFYDIPNWSLLFFRIQRIPSIIWETFYSVAEQTTRSSTEKKEQHEIWGDHHYPKRASYDQKMNQTLPASASSSLQ
jgi:hypothetical protein